MQDDQVIMLAVALAAFGALAYYQRTRSITSVDSLDSNPRSGVQDAFYKNPEILKSYRYSGGGDPSTKSK
jgi:hypothetical protein